MDALEAPKGGVWDNVAISNVLLLLNALARGKGILNEDFGRSFFVEFSASEEMGVPSTMAEPPALGVLGVLGTVGVVNEVGAVDVVVAAAPAAEVVVLFVSMPTGFAGEFDDGCSG